MVQHVKEKWASKAGKRAMGAIHLGREKKAHGKHMQIRGFGV
jgi:hypothetical protein